LSSIKTLNEADEFYLKKDYLNAYPIYLVYAQEGNFYAIRILWKMILYGYGVEKNIDIAYIWCKKASDMNDAEAQYFYANYCFEKKSYQEGKIYLDKAYNQNYLEAIRYMASNYFFGDFGYVKDVEKALNLYSEACIKGDSSACKDLYFINKNLVGSISSANYIREKIGFLKYLKNVTSK